MKVKPLPPPPLTPAPKPDAAPRDEIRRRGDEGSVLEGPESDRRHRAAEGRGAETDAAAAGRLRRAWAAQRHQSDHVREARRRRQVGTCRGHDRRVQDRRARSAERGLRLGWQTDLPQDRRSDRPVECGARRCASGSRAAGAALRLSPQQQNNGQPVPAAPGKEMPATVPGQQPARLRPGRQLARRNRGWRIQKRTQCQPRLARRFAVG